MMHVYDFIADPKQDALAREFFDHFCVPAMSKDEKWLREHPLFCTYEFKRYRCTGASRLGDVWLAEDDKREYGYDLRVDVEKCSEWSSTL